MTAQTHSPNLNDVPETTLRTLHDHASEMLLTNVIINDYIALKIYG